MLSVSDIAAAHATITAELKQTRGISAATTFGALLTVPELQSNCVRLEALVHLSLAHAEGKPAPSHELVDRAFADLGEGRAGSFEDPAEDVFVESIATPHGNFRVLPGVWESAAFYVERLTNVIELMPRRGVYDRLRESVYALLRLSDLVCERAGLTRHQLGNDIPAKAIPWNELPGSEALRQRLRFTPTDLQAAGVAPNALGVFALDANDHAHLRTAEIGNSKLERTPLIRDGDDFHFALPTATSAAIRRFIVERLAAMGQREHLVQALAVEYGRLFSSRNILGIRGSPDIGFTPRAHAAFGGTAIPIDTGRYLGLLFVLDDLAGFEKTGITGLPPEPDALSVELEAQVSALQAQIRDNPDFRAGLVLVVACGLGRGSFARFASSDPAWKLDALSAADLETLSTLPDFDALTLWRVLDEQQALQDLGVEIFNINGLLNLVAWVRSLQGHIVPHGSLPDGFGDPDASNLLNFDSNALRTSRHQAALATDTHVELDPRGRWVPVIKIGQSFFEEDRHRPLYGESVPQPGQKPRCVYVGSSRTWWCAVDVPAETPGSAAYDRWMTASVWLARAVPVLDRVFATLPAGLVLWNARFLGIPAGYPPDPAPLRYETARAQITATADPKTRTVSTLATPEFELAFVNEENIAERALVDAMIEGAALLAGQLTTPADRTDWLREIVPSAAARHSHAFRIHSFRDAVQDTLPVPIHMTDVDGATLVLGLGWRIRDRSESAQIEGESACTTYLNALVRCLEDQLCQELRAFDRLDIIHRVLTNHEAAAVDRERWNRTAAAMRALHDDKAAARDQMLLHELELNATFLSSRLLIEFALCESALQGGRPAGALDLARLMGLARLIFEFGSWSDAIRWQAMEPRLAISPMGEVRHKQEFLDTILKPFSRTASDQRLKQAVERYADHLKESEPVASVHGLFEPAFLEAIEDEYGASIDETRLFMDFIDDLGIRQNKAVLHVRRSELLTVEIHGQQLDPGKAGRLVDFLTLKTRPSWHEIPPGYDAKDLHPWRFRRRLSVLRKPLLQINEAEDPTVLVAPGLLREGVLHVLPNYHRGDYPEWQLKPKMKVWAGTATDTRGHAFADEVAGQLRSLGWKTETEVNVTRLLRKGFDRNYGDVDVLAWNPTNGRVLVVECKDVQYRKTHGEVAEQLGDFRGELRPNGKPDELRKHLDRVALINQHLAEVARFIGLPKVDRVESHLVFRNPVPMKYALQRMSERVTIHTFDDLGSL